MIDQLLFYSERRATGGRRGETERCPVNTGPEDCKPVMFFTTPNDGRFRACVSVSSKTQHKAGSKIQLATALNKR